MMAHRSALFVSILILMLTTVLAACGSSNSSEDAEDANRSSATAPATAPITAVSVDLAPEFADFEGWYNSEPLTLDALRGSPVLLVFWSDT